MSEVRWQRPPRGVRVEGMRVENLALVPTSLLPHKARYQRLANQLPAGAVLVVLPDADSPERQVLQQAAARFLAKGHPVTTLSVTELLAPERSRDRRAGAAPTTSLVASVPSVEASAPPAAVVALPSSPAPTPAPVDAPLLGTMVEVPPFTRELRLVSVDDSRNRARFYLLQWLPTLWGGVALVRVWGRIGAAGRAQVLVYADTPRLDATITRLVRRRLRHGYQVVDWH